MWGFSAVLYWWCCIDPLLIWRWPPLSLVVPNTHFLLFLSCPRRWISVAYNNGGLPRPPIYCHPLPSNPPSPHDLSPFPHPARNHQRVPPFAKRSAALSLGPRGLRGDHRGVGIWLRGDDRIRWWGLLQKVPSGHWQDGPSSSPCCRGWSSKPPRPPFLPCP